MKLKIDKLVYGGKGIGKISGKTFFVPYVVPGDVVDVREVSRKSGYSEAEVVRVLEYGEGRVKPKCPYFGRCGGCDWQHIDYKFQVDFKRDILEENLQKIGKIRKPNIDEVIPSPNMWNYRNRAQFKFRDGKLGFFSKGSHEIVDINSCPILKDDISKAIPNLKLLAKRLPTKPSEIHVYSSSSDEVLLKIVYPGKFKKLEFGVDEIKEITGLNVVGFGIYKQGENSNPERVKFFGRDFTYEKVGKFKFRVSADSFFQVNRFQVESLIDKVSKGASEYQYLIAADLYCGVGTLTVPVGRYVHRAFGIESSFSAVSDALYNRDVNGLRNITFFCRETEEGLSILKEGNPDLVIVDPPRSGLSQKVVREISNLSRLKRIIYVSCNPSTLARDIALFYQNGIIMERAKVIDMFPQTYHIETIAFLRKIG
jgi:23S rRNA (uracil1939-C5)-methyltransferase